MQVKVKPDMVGYYGHKRRYAGEVFAIKNEQAFSNKWMDKVSAEESAAAVSKKPVKGKKASEEKLDADFVAENAAEEDVI